MAEPHTSGAPTNSRLASLWDGSRVSLQEEIDSLDETALAGLEGRLTQDERVHAERDAHALAESLGSFGITEGARLARHVEWLLQGLRPLSGNDFLRLSELVVGIGQDFSRGPQLAAAGPHRDGGSVLIVEADHDLGRRLVEEATSRGVRAAVAGSVAAARAAIADSRPDLVLLDPADPAEPGGGRALLEELCLGGQPIPTMVLTAPGGPIDRAEVARLGGRGFLGKPIAASVVIDTVRQTLDRRRPATSILVVSDDDAMLATLRELLRPQGCEVVGLDPDDPGGLWHGLRSARPELLVLDLDPARHDSLQLCRMIRNDPGWERLPVVCVTIRSTDLYRRLYRGGADDVLLRPLDGAEVVERITNRLERSRLVGAESTKDLETGLPNWTVFETELRRQVVMARRYGQPLALAAVVVDEQDTLDQRYGQGAGEAARSALGRLLRRSFRLEDSVGTHQDGRLLAGMYGAEPSGAVTRMNTVLATFHDLEVTFEEQTFQATASAGLAMFPVDGSSVDTLYRAAVDALRRAEPGGGGRVLTASGAEPVRGSTVDVLVVDDDDALVALLMHALATQGYRAQRLRDGADAAERLLAPDGIRARVVLLEVDLPGLDGLTVLRELGIHGSLAKTRVIVVTFRASESEVLKALDLGAYDHIAKPLSIPVLMHRVRRAFESLAP